MQHRSQNKDKLLHRIRIIKGHLESIEKMISEDQYCLDIVHQSRAVHKALKKLDEKIVEDHLHNCVVDQIKSGDEERTTEELLTLFQYR